MHLPLQGKRILITRPRGQSSALANELEALGASPVLLPTIELAPPTSFCALDAALSSIRAFDWLLFTSANAVHAFTERARHLHLQPHPQRIAVIGPATAKAVQVSGLASAINLMPPRYVAESFVEALLPHAPGASMLLVRAAVARDLLPEALTAAGAAVTIATAYRTLIPPDSVATLRDLLSDLAHYPHAITFTSASTATNLAALLDAAHLNLPTSVVLASIGPITSAAMRDLNLEPTLEAAESTIPALVSAIAARFMHERSRTSP